MLKQFFLAKLTMWNLVFTKCGFQFVEFDRKTSNHK